MKFFKALFGSKEEKPEEKKKAEEAKNFDVLKYDGVRALRAGQAEFAIRCFTHALQMQDDLEIHDYLSQAYIRTGELTLAYEQLQKLAEAQPDNQQIFIRMANVAYMMEDYGAMAGACEKAMRHYNYKRRKQQDNCKEPRDKQESDKQGAGVCS